MNNNDQTANSIPPWVSTIMARLDQLEQHQQQQRPNSPMVESDDADPYIVERTPDTDLEMYDEFRQALPGVDHNFFKHPLPEADRRRFLAECPRNSYRTYTPPVLNNVNVNMQARQVDRQMADTLQRGTPSQQEIIDFINVVHELLVDTASYVTQLRIDNMCRAAGIRDPPRQAPSSAEPLVDPKALVDHVALQQAVRKTGYRSSFRKGKGKANSSHKGHQSDDTQDDIKKMDQKSASQGSPKKDFYPGHPSRDKGKRVQTSSQ